MSLVKSRLLVSLGSPVGLHLSKSGLVLGGRALGSDFLSQNLLLHLIVLFSLLRDDVELFLKGVDLTVQLNGSYV